MDAVDEVGCSALHLCAEHGYYRMIKLLLEVGFGTRLQKSRIDPNFSSLCEDSSLTAVEVANSTGCLRLENAGRTPTPGNPPFLLASLETSGRRRGLQRIRSRYPLEVLSDCEKPEIFRKTERGNFKEILERLECKV